MSTESYEIVVWVKGHTTGTIFRGKSKDLAEEVMTCVGAGKGIKLVTDSKVQMVFGPGMISHIQVTKVGGYDR